MGVIGGFEVKRKTEDRRHLQLNAENKKTTNLDVHIARQSYWVDISKSRDEFKLTLFALTAVILKSLTKNRLKSFVLSNFQREPTSNLS